MDNDKLIEMLAGQMEAQNKLLKEITAGQLHTKTPANFGTYTELHGNGSLFGSYPIERDVITAHIRPLPGLITMLPKIPSTTEQPIFATITGFTATSGSEPAYPCSDAPAGYMKGCNLSAAFGRYMRDTQTIEINDTFMRFNRGDFTDLVLRGQVLGEGTPFLPGSITQEQMLNIVTKSEMVIAGVNLQRLLTTQVWQGNPANNNAGGGYREFPGLDRQIATGQKDWETGTLCPALDSDVKDFAWNNVNGTDGRDIVEYLSALEYYLTFNAEQMGLTPTQWVIVMRPQLWFELSSVWPCSYLSNRCIATGLTNTTANHTMVINDNVNVSMRDAMRNGMFIDINGHRYPVVTDMGIYEYTNITNAHLRAGEYASSIYMVPLTITGGFPVTYYEYKNYLAAAPDIALLNNTQEFWTDSGMFFWAMEQVKFCYKLTVKTEPRIILRTPQLAGRIDSVKYSPLQHNREFDPSNTYFRDGGVSLRANTTGSHVW